MGLAAASCPHLRGSSSPQVDLTRNVPVGSFLKKDFAAVAHRSPALYTRAGKSIKVRRVVYNLPRPYL